MTYNTVNLVPKQLDLMLDDESIDQNTYDYLYPLEHKTKTPHCYFLPKVHKNTPLDWVFIGRPRVSNCGGPCEKIGEFINFFLEPPRAKTTNLLDGHKRCDKKYWATETSKTLSFGHNWLYWNVHQCSSKGGRKRSY